MYVHMHPNTLVHVRTHSKHSFKQIVYFNFLTLYSSSLFHRVYANMVANTIRTPEIGARGKSARKEFD